MFEGKLELYLGVIIGSVVYFPSNVRVSFVVSFLGLRIVILLFPGPALLQDGSIISDWTFWHYVFYKINE